VSSAEVVPAASAALGEPVASEVREEWADTSIMGQMTVSLSKVTAAGAEMVAPVGRVVREDKVATAEISR
jgi:hypothetical protein